MLNRIAVVVIVLFVSGTAFAASFDISGPAANNVDTDPATVVSIVTGTSGIVTDMNLRVEINDSGWGVGEIDIYLRHGTTTVQVYIGGGGLGAMDATFDDEATAAYPASGDVTGTVLPSPGSLSAFDGMSLSGSWDLILHDNTVPGDGDDLVSWSIFGEIAAVPEPATYALFGLGLLGMAAWRRRRGAAARRTS